MYEMATGRRPFSGANVGQTIERITHAQPEAIARFNYNIPAELERIVRKCLEKDRERRYQSARDLLVDLSNLKRNRDREVGTVLPSRRRRPRKAIHSLAVLPLVNASADPNTEYLSDGISESLINSFSQLPRLRVMARSTVFRYKGREVDPQEVGRDLGVGAVLTGRVLQVGDKLVIRTELVDAADGSQLWGEQYSRKLSDIFTVQEEISQEISEKLRLRLSREEKKKLTKRYTENVEAYQLYLKGRYYASKYSKEGFKKGIEYFNQAIAMDPSYSLGYEGLAYNYIVASEWLLPARDAIPKVRAAANKALELDEKLAEAHTWLGSACYWYDWDWVAAEREFKRAIELNPNYATAHQVYGLHLTLLGRFDQALEENKRAQELDPLSLETNTFLGLSLYFARRYDQAIEQLRKTMEMDPNYWFAYLYLGRVYEQKGEPDKAIVVLQKAKLIENTNPELLAALGHAYAVSGRKGEAQKVLDELNQRSKESYVAPYFIATIYAGLEEKEQAFGWLEKGHEERSFYLTWLKVDPNLDSLRSDPRFTDLLRRVGLMP
jgi:TolB-like protein/Tfp pilus assembly protein PilF